MLKTCQLTTKCTSDRAVALKQQKLKLLYDWWV